MAATNTQTTAVLGHGESLRHHSSIIDDSKDNRKVGWVFVVRMTDIPLHIEIARLQDEAPVFWVEVWAVRATLTGIHMNNITGAYICMDRQAALQTINNPCHVNILVTKIKKSGTYKVRKV